MENIIFDELKKLTNKAIEENEVPIAAIILKNDSMKVVMLFQEK